MYLEKTFENEYKSAHWRQTRMAFLSLNLHEFPQLTIVVRRKEPQGSSSVIHFFYKQSAKTNYKKSARRPSPVKVFVVLRFPIRAFKLCSSHRWQIHQKMQTPINSSCSRNFTEFDELVFSIDMIDWFKIVRASWITKFMWNTKYFPWRFRTSETPKLSNKDGFMLLLNCRKRRSNLQSFSLHLTNHRSSHGLLCLTHLFNAFATIVCWDPRVYAKRFVLRTFYSKFIFFATKKYAL